MGKCLNFGLYLTHNLCRHQGIQLLTHCGLSQWHHMATTKVDFSLVRFWWNSPDSNFTFSIEATMLHNEIENYSFEMTATFPSSQWVNKLLSHRRQGIYRPVQITERFSIFYQWLGVKVYHLANKFLLTCLGFDIGNNVRIWIRK